MYNLYKSAILVRSISANTLTGALAAALEINNPTRMASTDGESDDNFVIYDSSIHFPLFVDSSSCYFAV